MYREFLVRYPDHTGAKFSLARTLIYGELDPEEGLVRIDSLLEQYPESLEGKDLRAWALHKLGRNQEALELLERNQTQDLGFNLYRYQKMQKVREALSAAS